MGAKKNYDTWFCKYDSKLYGSGVIDFDGGFCADPFFISDQLIVYEFFDYEDQRGWVECFNIRSKQRKKILDNGAHMSYPFVYLRDGNIYLLPEENQLRRLCVHQVIDFDGYGFPIVEEAFDLGADARIVDAMMFELNGHDYLIYNCDIGAVGDPGSTLLLRQIEFKSNGFNCYPSQLISADFRTTRNGGSIVKFDGGLKRIFQRKSAGVYGDGIGISRLKLDVNGRWIEDFGIFDDELYAGININSTHHVDVNHPEWGVVWDERR